MNRTEAIEKVKDMRDIIIREHSPNDVFVSHMNEAIKVLSEERPHGEWICKGSVGDGTWCSVCDTNIKLFPNRYSFCPNCGSDNRKKEDKPHGS